MESNSLNQNNDNVLLTLSCLLDELKSKQTENKGGGTRPIDYHINCVMTTMELLSKSQSSNLSRDDRLKLGIKKYGFDSDFMKEYNLLRSQLRYDEVDVFFDKWLIER